MTPLVPCRTKDISSGGFYCFSHEPLTAGEWLQCTIVFPDRAPRSGGFALKCSIEVLRVELVDAGRTFGIACRINDYSVVPQPKDFSAFE